MTTATIPASLRLVLHHGIVQIGLFVLLAITAAWVAGAVVKIARSEKPDEPLSNVGMLIGLGWSSEAVWVLTGPGGANLNPVLRVVLFAICEVILGVFMIRAKRNMREIGRPGRAGMYTWFVAAGMSVVASFTAHNAGEWFLRLIVPLMLTAMWWNGLVGEGATKPKDATTVRWTPRRLLLAVGAIEAGDRDVETVNRDRLVQQMVECDRRRAGARSGTARKSRLEGKLTRLSEKADPAIIEEVRRKRSQSTWWSVTQPSQPGVTQDDAPSDAASGGQVAQRDGAAGASSKLASSDRRGLPTSSDAGDAGDATGSDADPATRAAQLVMTQGMSIREAARKVPGAADATVRRRIKVMGGGAAGAALDADAGQTPDEDAPINGHSVLSNG